MSALHNSASDFDVYNSLILIVDDYANNLKVLGTILKRAGFRIAVCSSGQDALDFLREKNIDLILMDIMMPGMDGITTCKKIKEDFSNGNIPVIFLSAKTDPQEKVKGFEAGGVDYITKPFDSSEVLARVKAHLQLKRSKDMLQNYHQRLESLVDQQAGELIRMEREAAFSLVTQGVVHNMNNPLASVIASAELLHSSLSLLLESDQPTEQLEKLQAGLELNNIILQGSTRLSQMVDNLMMRGKQNHHLIQKERFDLNNALRKECTFFRKYHLKSHTKLNLKSTNKKLCVYMVKNELLQVMNNLLQNAQDALYKTGGEITVELSEENEQACISVSDSGKGISDEILPHIFEPFFSTKNGPDSKHESKPRGTGLGLYYCSQIIEGYKGKITVQSGKNETTSFKIFLPLYRPGKN